MSNSAITCQFHDNRSAFQAFDTLEELGYRTVLETVQGVPTLTIFIESNDLTSALEIVQAHGGILKEDAAPEEKMYADAYGLDQVPVPAHIVNEDLEEPYLHPDDSTNHFSADVRI